MKVLVTGVKGQLGWDVVKRLEKNGVECKGVDIDDFDLTDKEQTVSYITAYRPDAIVHCAAYTAVDKAEEAKEICYNVNVGGTANIRAAAQACGSVVVYISTDYVFPGTGEKPWEPGDETGPCNYYGLTKLKGEEALKGYDKLFIIRISWVFGINGRNFVKTMLALSEKHSELKVVDDQIGSPTYTYDLAKLICKMLETDKYGTYHATNEGFCSWADFADYIFECADKQVKVNHISTEEYGKTPAVRPKNSRMSKEALTVNGFERLPDWKDAVGRYVNILMSEGK